jgi:hypothetical protein
LLLLCARTTRFDRTMDTHKISLPLDEELVRRARDQDVGWADESDDEVRAVRSARRRAT